MPSPPAVVQTTEGPNTQGDTTQSASPQRVSQPNRSRQTALANTAGVDKAGLNTQGGTTQQDATERAVQRSGTQRSSIQQTLFGKGSEPEATADSPETPTVQHRRPQHNSIRQTFLGRNFEPEARADTPEAPSVGFRAETGPEKMSKCQRVPGVNDFWRSFMINNLNPEQLDLRRPGEVADPAKPVTVAANLLVWRRSNMRVLNVLLVLSVICKILGFAARIRDLQNEVLDLTPVSVHIDRAQDRLCVAVCNRSTVYVNRGQESCREMLSLQGVVGVAKNQMSADSVRENITFALNKTIEMCRASEAVTFAGYCRSFTQCAGQSTSSSNEATALLSLANPLCSDPKQINATCRAFQAQCSKGLSDGDQLLTCAASVVHGYVNQVSTVPIDAIQGNVSQILESVAEGCSLISNFSGFDNCYDTCRQGVLQLRSDTTNAIIEELPGEVINAVRMEYVDRADAFARFQYSKVFLSAYDAVIEVLTLFLAIPGSMNWLCYRDSRSKLMKACAVKLILPFVISFVPVYTMFGIGDVASVRPELLIYRMNLGMQIQSSVTGIFISTVPTIAYAAWVMLSLVPASSLWALFIFMVPFLQLMVIWPASVSIVQYLGDWGCAIGFAMGCLAYLFYCPPAYAILFRSDAHDDYAIFRKWYSRSLYVRLLSYVVLGVFGTILFWDLKTKYAPDMDAERARLVVHLLNADTFNSMLIAPNVIYYICIIAYVDAAVGLLAMMRKREGYLASDPTVTELCQLLNSDLTNVVTRVTTDTTNTTDTAAGE